MHNVAKPGRKRQLEKDDTPVPAPKRGRPKRDALLERYPSLNPPSACTESQKALDKELEKETPRKDIVLPLVNSTFHYRRPLVVQSAVKNVPIHRLLTQHKCLRLIYVVRQCLCTCLMDLRFP